MAAKRRLSLKEYTWPLRGYPYSLFILCSSFDRAFSCRSNSLNHCFERVLSERVQYILLIFRLRRWTVREKNHHHHQTPWDQRPLVSTARFTRILHPALSTASPANKWMSLLHRWMISSDYLLLGLPLRFLPRSIPNSTLFTSLSSSMLQIWPKNVNFLSITLCTMFRCLPILVRIAWFRIFCCHLIFSILL